jgi:hypothetical protein
MIKVIFDDDREAIEAVRRKETFVYISGYTAPNGNNKYLFVDGEQMGSSRESFAKIFWDHYKNTSQAEEAMAYLLGKND